MLIMIIYFNTPTLFPKKTNCLSLLKCIFRFIRAFSIDQISFVIVPCSKTNMNRGLAFIELEQYVLKIHKTEAPKRPKLMYAEKCDRSDPGASYTWK